MMLLTGSRTATSRQLLRATLSLCLGSSALPRLQRGPAGKPYFPDRPALQFNLTHSRGLCFCLLDTEHGRPLGIDAERIRPRSPGLAAYALSPGEYRSWRRRGGGWENFYRLWTQREAYCKYTGRGLYAHRREEIPLTTLRWQQFCQPDFVLTLCGEHPLPSRILWLGERFLRGF